ncbi:MAG: Gfo/Idh/MocA family oxidoreductase [Bacteroidaceae bacterium]|nr:Gfo/Idh/MocA family oxidoreductase [Bacteroidaceae bacterium]
MNVNKLRWGFIGCGEVTETKSGPAFSIVEDSEVVAVMSRTAEKARDYAKRHNIPHWYSDAQELIDDIDVNAIYIATPPSSHATFAVMAMQSGKPCYIEKPLAASYDDCVRINRVSERTGIPCFVAYYRRELDYFKRVKQLIDDGAVGNVVNVQIRFACPPHEADYNAMSKLPWRLQPDIAGGGYFYDLAAHQLDFLQQLFGVITEAKGLSANRGGLYAAEDSVSACFRFENGLPASGSWCFVSHPSAKEDRIYIIGDRGTLKFSVFTYEPITLLTTEGKKDIEIPAPPVVQLPLIKRVVNTLLDRDTCDCTSVSATPTNWVMDIILNKF